MCIYVHIEYVICQREGCLILEDGMNPKRFFEGSVPEIFDKGYVNWNSAGPRLEPRGETQQSKGIVVGFIGDFMALSWNLIGLSSDIMGCDGISDM